MGKLTTALLQRAARLADEKAKVQGQLTAAFEERYGTTYSEADCDRLIDILDYHGGHINLNLADRYMAECDCFPAGRAALTKGSENSHE